VYPFALWQIDCRQRQTRLVPELMVGVPTNVADFPTGLGDQAAFGLMKAAFGLIVPSILGYDSWQLKLFQEKEKKVGSGQQSA